MPTQKDVLTFLTTIKPQLQKDGIEKVFEKAYAFTNEISIDDF